MENFNFNPGNFLLGLLSGWASAYAVYRARHVLSAAQESVSRQASSAQEFASRSADRRYIQDLTKYINSAHLLGDRVPLTDLIVEPYFIRSEPIAAPPDEDVIRTVFHVVPNIPDHPYIQAPYNVETMSIEMLARGSRAISLLGRPGSGKTTALFAIALWSIGEVNFDPPSDAVQERLSEEEQNLNDEQRAERIRNFVQVEQLRERAEESGEAAQRRAASFRQLTPIYVHLADVRTDSGEFGRRIDPAEPLVRAAQKYTTRVTRQTMAGNVYERMAEGKALLLLDGYEDLPAPEQQNKLRWFRALLNTYPDNFYITTGPVIGYGSISDIGFDPVFIRPWNDVQINRFVENWSQAWPRIAGQHQRGDYTPPPDILEAALRDNRIRSPFDLTVKLWGNFTDAKDESYESWIRGLLGSFMGNEPIGTLLPKLAVAAQSQLDSGYVSVGSMVDLASGKSVTYTEPAAQEAAGSDDASFLDDVDTEYDGNPFADVDDDAAFLEELEAVDDEDVFEETSAPAAASEVSTQEQTESAATDEKKLARDYNKLIGDLVKSGLIVAYRGGRYQFRHTEITAYLGSLALREMNGLEQIEKADDPAWSSAVAYAALHMPMDDLLEQKLNRTDDVLYKNVLETAHWLARAGRDVEWKRRLLSQLGNMLVAPNQYPLRRERAAAALVSTRDPGAVRVFMRGLDHPEPDVRRLSCLGIGVLREERSTEKLLLLLDDADIDVQLAAAMALGAIGTPTALEEITYTMMAASEPVRQVIAETFALIPDEGYPVLYDAVNHEEMPVRRAAVFGLRRINTPWALIAIYERSVEDQQFYVKAAAETAFQTMLFGDQASGVQRRPQVENIPWLREWIMQLGPEALEEETPENYLKIIAQTGSPMLKQISLANIGQLGLFSHMDILYGSLRDNDEEIRETAHRALGELQSKLGENLPSPA